MNWMKHWSRCQPSCDTITKYWHGLKTLERHSEKKVLTIGLKSMKTLNADTLTLNADLMNWQATALLTSQQICSKFIVQFIPCIVSPALTFDLVRAFCFLLNTIFVRTNCSSARIRRPSATRPTDRKTWNPCKQRRLENERNLHRFRYLIFY